MKQKSKIKLILSVLPNDSIKCQLALSQCKTIEIGMDELPEDINKMKYELNCLN